MRGSSPHLHHQSGLLGWLVRRVQLAAERSRGRRAGRRDIPNTDEQKPPFDYDRLEASGVSRISELAAWWSTTRGVVGGLYCGLAHRVIEEDKPAVTAAALALNTAEAGLAEASEALRKLMEQFRRSGKRWRVGPTLFKAAVGVIVPSDFALNSLVFQTFGESEFLTLIFTAGFTAAFVLVAHLLGGLLAQTDVTFRERCASWGAALGLLAACPLIAFVRVDYAHAATHSSGGVVFQGQAIGLASGGGHPIGSLLGFGMYSAASLMIVGATTLLSFLFHDPSATPINQAQRQVRDARREHNNRKDDHSAALATATAHLVSMAALDQEDRGTFDALAQLMQREAQRRSVLWSGYCASNRRTRRVRRPLPALDRPLRIEVPEPFRSGNRPSFGCGAVRAEIDGFMRDTRIPPTLEGGLA